MPSPGAPDYDQNLSSPSSPTTNSPPVSNSIPIKSQQQQQQQQQTPSSFFDYLSESFSNRYNANKQLQQTTKATPPPPPPPSQPSEFTVPLAAPSKKLWISDDDVSTCMCCNETQFSMFHRRHHCRRCGRVVCKACSQHMTRIKDRLERTCKDCYQFKQNTPIPIPSSRPETNNPTRKFDNFRP
jgi:hypothetical protein